jgi:hypothetical protein
VDTAVGTGGDMDNVHMACAWVQLEEDEVKVMVLQNKDKEDEVPDVDMGVLGSVADKKHMHLDNDQTRQTSEEVLAEMQSLLRILHEGDA